MNCWAKERAVRIDIIVIPCLWNKGRILSTNDVSLPKTFSMVCLILATCAWICFRFCDGISGFACFRYHFTAAFVLQKKYDHFLAFNLIALFLYKTICFSFLLAIVLKKSSETIWNIPSELKPQILEFIQGKIAFLSNINICADL